MTLHELTREYEILLQGNGPEWQKLKDEKGTLPLPAEFRDKMDKVGTAYPKVQEWADKRVDDAIAGNSWGEKEDLAFYDWVVANIPAKAQEIFIHAVWNLALTGQKYEELRAIRIALDEPKVK